MNEELNFTWRLSALIPIAFDRSEKTINHLLEMASVLTQMNTMIKIENNVVFVTSSAEFSFDQQKTIERIVSIFEIAESIRTFLEEQDRIKNLSFEDDEDLNIIYPLNQHQFRFVH